MTGRRFSHVRRARLSECDPRGRLRYDAMACWLQDIAADDVRDAGLGDADGLWLLRRINIAVTSWPRYREDVEVVTWASGTGGAVAERRTSMGSGAVEATAVWAAVDPHTMRPIRLTDRFYDIYGASSAGRRVTARLTHPDPPEGAIARDWPLRYTDLDRVGHVNNAAYLAAAEDIFEGDPPKQLEIEYRTALNPTPTPQLLTTSTAMWFVQTGRVTTTLRWKSS